MATHSFDASTVSRCVEHEHVDADYACTHLLVTDVNQGGRARILDADDVRELALALSERAATLHRQGKTRRLAALRQLAVDLALDDFAGIRCFSPDDTERE